MKDLIIEFFLSIIPPVFAILTALFSSTAQSAYFETAISHVMVKEDMDQKYKPLLKNIVNSSITLVSILTTIFSCLLSIIIIILKFPKEYSIPCGVLIALSVIVVFQRWIWEMFSLDLNEMSDLRPINRKATRGDQAFHKLTYAKLFNRRQYYFNLIIILIMSFGFFIDPIQKWLWP